MVTRSNACCQTWWAGRGRMKLEKWQPCVTVCGKWQGTWNVATGTGLCVCLTQAPLWDYLLCGLLERTLSFILQGESQQLTCRDPSFDTDVCICCSLPAS